jgi:hypothetical protein
MNNYIQIFMAGIFKPPSYLRQAEILIQPTLVSYSTPLKDETGNSTDWSYADTFYVLRMAQR